MSAPPRDAPRDAPRAPRYDAGRRRSPPRQGGGGPAPVSRPWPRDERWGGPAAPQRRVPEDDRVARGRGPPNGRPWYGERDERPDRRYDERFDEGRREREWRYDERGAPGRPPPPGPRLSGPYGGPTHAAEDAARHSRSSQPPSGREERPAGRTGDPGRTTAALPRHVDLDFGTAAGRGAAPTPRRENGEPRADFRSVIAKGARERAASPAAAAAAAARPAERARGGDATDLLSHAQHEYRRRLSDATTLDALPLARLSELHAAHLAMLAALQDAEWRRCQPEGGGSPSRDSDEADHTPLAE